MSGPNPVNELRNMVKANRGPAKIYISFFAIIFFLYILCSDGDFSFLLTLSSLIGSLSFLMVSFCVFSAKSVSGISLNMILCYVFIFLFRLFSIIPYQGYVVSNLVIYLMTDLGIGFTNFQKFHALS